MALSIASQIQGGSGESEDHFGQLWLRTLEAYLPAIRQRDDNALKAVEPALALRYQGDFYGLLRVLNIAFQYHWITMRLNGYHTTTEFGGDVSQIMVPNTSYIDQLRVLYITLYRKNTQ